MGTKTPKLSSVLTEFAGDGRQTAGGVSDVADRLDAAAASTQFIPTPQGSMGVTRTQSINAIREWCASARERERELQRYDHMAAGELKRLWETTGGMSHADLRSLGLCARAASRSAANSRTSVRRAV
eukprot:Hpha_TRINITY_DN12354_c0_g2::TRINITY_DN12354_c0_g2_i2::g.156177::m.156177